MRGAATFLLIACVSWVQPAVAQDGPRLAQAASQAAKEFKAHIDKMARAKGSLDLSAPPASDLLAKMCDVNPLQGLARPIGADLPWLTEWVSACASSTMLALSFGTNPRSADYVEVMSKNEKRYEDELTQIIDFSLRGGVRVHIAARDFLDALPERDRKSRQNNYNNLRAGLISTVMSSLDFLVNDTKLPNAKRLSAALRDIAPDWATLLSDKERADLLSQIANTREKVSDADVSANLAAMSSTLSATR